MLNEVKLQIILKVLTVAIWLTKRLHNLDDRILSKAKLLYFAVHGKQWNED